MCTFKIGGCEGPCTFGCPQVSDMQMEGQEERIIYKKNSQIVQEILDKISTESVNTHSSVCWLCVCGFSELMNGLQGHMV